MLGTQLGDYVIQKRIGAGGMGVVYRGIQPVIGKHVAIKVLKNELAQDAHQVQRLVTEARLVNAIQHRGIIDIFGFGELPDGRHYVIMELLRGAPLHEFLGKHGRLQVSDAVQILDEVLAALGAAHSAGVVHLDLKPSNIFLIEQQDGSRFVKLLDFGIAKQTHSNQEMPPTVCGQLIGTPEYMAPEQVRGTAVGPRTDLYALGVLTFKMLTGSLPFERETPVGILTAHLDDTPPKPSALVSTLSPRLDALVLQMLAKNPEERPRSTDEVRSALKLLVRSSASESTLMLPAVIAAGATGPVAADEALATTAEVIPEAAAPSVVPAPPPSPSTPPRVTAGRAQRRAKPISWRWLGAGVTVMSLGTGAVWLAKDRRPAPAAPAIAVSATPPQAAPPTDPARAAEGPQVSPVVAAPSSPSQWVATAAPPPPGSAARRDASQASHASAPSRSHKPESSSRRAPADGSRKRSHEVASRPASPGPSASPRPSVPGPTTDSQRQKLLDRVTQLRAKAAQRGVVLTPALLAELDRVANKAQKADSADHRMRLQISLDEWEAKAFRGLAAGTAESSATPGTASDSRESYVLEQNKAALKARIAHDRRMAFDARGLIFGTSPANARLAQIERYVEGCRTMAELNTTKRQLLAWEHHNHY